jgi:GDP-L-fucose synthase
VSSSQLAEVPDRVRSFGGDNTHVVGYQGKIEFDTWRPDSPPQKLLDVSKIKKLGWSPKIGLYEGLAGAYADFLAGGGRLGG